MTRLFLLLPLLAATVTLESTAQEVSALSCADFRPTPEAMQRFPHLRGACEGVVERNGELYGKFSAVVRRVRGNNVTLYLPATEHTFTVRPDPSTRILVHGKRTRARDLVPKQKIHIYLSASEFAEPDVANVAFLSDSDFLIDIPIDDDTTLSIPGRKITNTVLREAIVEAVNHETREIKVIDADGQRHTFIAGDMVRNFDQIEPRDRIVTEYQESVAIFVVPAGTPEFGDATAVDLAPPGDKPGFAAADSYMVSATIEAIDPVNRTATLLGDDGEEVTISLSDDVPLEGIEVGDEVRMRVTEAIAISVREAPAN